MSKGSGVQFYGYPDKKAIVFAPYEPPAEAPDQDSVLARHRPGARTLAHREHDRAGPGAVAKAVPDALVTCTRRMRASSAAPRQRSW